MQFDPNPQVTTALTDPTTPAGYDLVTTYIAPAANALGAQSTGDTIDFSVAVPFQLTQSDWDSLLQGSLASTIAGMGWQLLAYGVSGQPGSSLDVPTQICVGGSCIAIPGQLCLPPPLPTDWCVNLGGQTIAAFFDYRVWLLIAPAAPSSYRMGFRARGQILIVVTIIVAILGILGAVGGVHDIFSGQWTFPDVTNFIKEILAAPTSGVGNQVDSTILLIGGIMLVSAIAVPLIVGSKGIPYAPPIHLGASGGVTGPGGIGARADFKS